MKKGLSKKDLRFLVVVCLAVAILAIIYVSWGNKYFTVNEENIVISTDESPNIISAGVVCSYCGAIHTDSRQLMKCWDARQADEQYKKETGR